MKRRQVILGLGASATGGSALLGSGAFSSVSAERDVSVEVTGDDSAYLRLGPCTDEQGDPKPNGAYAFQGEDGLFSISLSDNNGNSPPDGSGVNPEALSKFHNVFEICNQGTQEVCVNFGIDGDVPTIPEGAHVPERFDFGTGDDAVVFYKGSDESDTFDITSSDADDGFELDVGECQCFGFNVRAFGFDSGEDLFADTDLTIIADADAECTVEEPPECGKLESEFGCVSTSETGGVISLENHQIEIDNTGTGPVDSFGVIVLDSPDQVEDEFEEFDNEDPPLMPTFDTSAPVLGVTFWVPSEGCDSSAPVRDEWTNDTSNAADFSDDAVDELSGIDATRYSNILNIEDFEDLNEQFDDTAGDDEPTDLFEVVPEDAVIEPVNYGEYTLEFTSDGGDFDSPVEEVHEKYSCDE